MTVALPVSSPCIDICLLDNASGLCVGCGRTMEEIAGWSAMGETERRAKMSELPARIAALGDVAAAPGEALARIDAVLLKTRS